MTIGRIPSVEGGIQPTIVDAKGDLIAGVAADSINRLAVGSNDQVLVADSSTSTGLAWKSVATPFAAGKNAIINGDFRINQRSLTSTTTDGAYGFDRWRMYASSGGTYSAQTFTPGTAPVTGYEAVNFARIVTTGQSGAGIYTSLDQPIEDARKFAGQTVTISFWAKAASGTPKVSLELNQNFGSGGSGTVSVNAGTVTISTSWARYTATVAIPSISGATIGTGSNLNLVLWVSAGTNYASRTNSIGIQSNTFDFWGVQLEAGSVATPFQTATGTLQGELAACQRYYQRFQSDSTYNSLSIGSAKSTTQVLFQMYYPSLRTIPTVLDYGGTMAVTDNVSVSPTLSTLAFSPDAAGRTSSLLVATVASGLTQYRTYNLVSVGTSTAYIGIGAEL